MGGAYRRWPTGKAPEPVRWFACRRDDLFFSDLPEVAVTSSHAGHAEPPQLADPGEGGRRCGHRWVSCSGPWFGHPTASCDQSFMPVVTSLLRRVPLVCPIVSLWWEARGRHDEFLFQPRPVSANLAAGCDCRFAFRKCSPANVVAARPAGVAPSMPRGRLERKVVEWPRR